MADEKNIRVNLLADDKNLEKGLKSAQSKIEGFGKSVNRLGSALAGALIVRKIIQIGKESSILEGKMQGVERAFKRLNDPLLLDRLIDATRGTVSELQLMQKAVMADNFRIPLDLLEKGLRFATQRAKETGLEVDYLVNSFVTGIGRKSQLVMDNLGISVLELQEEIKKTGDFATSVGNIMDRQMSDAGDAIETSADKTMKLTAAWTDFQMKIGKDVNPTLDKLKDKLIGIFDFMSDTPAQRTAKEFLEDFIKLDLDPLDKLADKVKAVADEKQHWENRMQDLNEALTETRKLSKDQRVGMEAELRIATAIVDVFGQYGQSLTEVNKETGLTIEEFKALHEEFVRQEELAAKQAEYMNDMAEATHKAGVEMEWFTDLMEEEQRVIDGSEVAIKNYVDSQAEAASELEMVNAVIAQSFTDLWTTLGEGIGNLATGGMESFFENILKTVADFAVKFGALLISMGISREALSKLGATGVPAIVAGIALVALGTAMKGLLSSAGNMNLSGGSASAGSVPSGGGYGGGMNVNVTGRLQGSTILLASERASVQRNAVT